MFCLYVGLRVQRRNRTDPSGQKASAAGSRFAASGSIVAGAGSLQAERQEGIERLEYAEDPAVEHPPLLNPHDGGRSEEAIRWDAEAEVAIATFIHDHLRKSPAPVGSAVAHDLASYASSLQLDGQARLEELGPARHLRAV